MTIFRHDDFEIPVGRREVSSGPFTTWAEMVKVWVKVGNSRNWVQMKSFKETQCLDKKRKGLRTEFWGTPVFIQEK